jgi:tetratricopeptide (TPR) repeat protein
MSKIIAIIMLALLCAAVAAAQQPNGTIVNADGKPVQIDEKAIQDAVDKAMVDFKLTACQIVLDSVPKYGDRSMEVAGWSCFGREYTARGRFAEAIEAFDNALIVAIWLRDNGAIAAQYHNRGATYSKMAEYDKALHDLRYALLIDEMYGNNDALSSTINTIGTVQMQTGHYAEAMASFNQAAALTQGLKGEHAIAPLTNLAAIYQDLGDTQRAIELNNRVVTLAEGELDHGLLATAHNNLGTIYRDHGDYGAARYHFTKAIEIAQRMHDSAGEAVFRFNLAFLQFQNGEIQPAGAMLEQARKAAETNTTKQMSAMFDALDGLLLLQRGSPAAALAAFQRSRVMLEGIGITEQVSEIWKAISAALGTLGRHDDAIEALRNSVRFAEEMRLKGHTPELREHLFEKNYDAYTTLVSELLDRGKNVEAFAAAERSRARVFLDDLMGYFVSLKQSPQAQGLLTEITALDKRRRLSPSDEQLRTLLDRKRADYASLIQTERAGSAGALSMAMAEPMTVSQVQAALGDDATLLSYWAAGNTLAVFIVRHNYFDAVVLGQADLGSLQKEVQYLRDFALLDDSVPVPLARLYDALIRPIASRIAGRSLIIVPCDVLHYVPFAALHDGRNYLSDQYAISMLPSASALGASPKRTKRTGVLATAVSSADAGSLPYAVASAKGVAAMFSTDALLDDKVTVEAVRKRLPLARYALLAAHAELNREYPLFSRIQLAASANDDGFLNLYDVREMQLNAEIVVLSGCNTQIGKISSGEEVAALSRAFLGAGAGSVVATLWSVKDEATAELVQEFFRRIRDNVPIDAALQQAQHAVRKAWPHPYYWAGFTVTGNVRR